MSLKEQHDEAVDRSITENFHRLYYGHAEREQPFSTLTWRGVPIYKCPEDLMMYQEILFERKPDLIVECGVARGGSTLFLADMCRLIGKGRVLGIDVTLEHVLPRVRQHERVSLIEGSSVAPATIDKARNHIHVEPTIMVILDSDHSAAHVLDELRIYSTIVTPGQYLIVEDTNVNGHPVAPWHGAGPFEAVEHFMTWGHQDFEIDRSRERLRLTFNPNGYLLKKATP